MSVAEKVTEEFKDFLYSALAIDPGLRPPAKKLLAHPFLFINQYNGNTSSGMSQSMGQSRNPSIFSNGSGSSYLTGTATDSLMSSSPKNSQGTGTSGSVIMGSGVMMGARASTDSGMPRVHDMADILNGDDVVVSPSTAAATSDASTFLGTF